MDVDRVTQLYPTVTNIVVPLLKIQHDARDVFDRNTEIWDCDRGCAVDPAGSDADNLIASNPDFRTIRYKGCLFVLRSSEDLSLDIPFPDIFRYTESRRGEPDTPDVCQYLDYLRFVSDESVSDYATHFPSDMVSEYMVNRRGLVRRGPRQLMPGTENICESAHMVAGVERKENTSAQELIDQAQVVLQKSSAGPADHRDAHRDVSRDADEIMSKLEEKMLTCGRRRTHYVNCLGEGMFLCWECTKSTIRDMCDIDGFARRVIENEDRTGKNKSQRRANSHVPCGTPNVLPGGWQQ